MEAQEFEAEVKAYCEELGFEINIQNPAGTYFSAIHKGHTIQAWLSFQLGVVTKEPTMEIKGMTIFLGLQVSSGKIQFKHPRAKEYIANIHEMVQAHNISRGYGGR